MATEVLNIVAIELGSSKVIGVAGVKRLDGKIEVTAHVQQDSATFIRKGIIHNEDLAISCIQNIIAKLKEKLQKEITQVYVCYSGQGVHSVHNEVSRLFESDHKIVKEDIDGIYEEVHRIGGLFIPAHVNKGTTSLMSQLGFIPPDLKADGLEINKFTTRDEFVKKFAYLKKFGFITDSDAHFINNVGDVYNVIYMEHRSFEEFAKALRGEDGRYIDTMAFREK